MGAAKLINTVILPEPSHMSRPADALRFFAPAAGPLNHHGASLERMDQLRLEQPACGTYCHSSNFGHV
jgi:hypothetical protein